MSKFHLNRKFHSRSMLAVNFDAIPSQWLPCNFLPNERLRMCLCMMTRFPAKLFEAGSRGMFFQCYIILSARQSVLLVSYVPKLSLSHWRCDDYCVAGCKIKTITMDITNQFPFSMTWHLFKKSWTQWIPSPSKNLPRFFKTERGMVYKLLLPNFRLPGKYM